MEPVVYSLSRKGQMVRLIDTPGLDDSKRPDIDILTDLAYYLTVAYDTKPKLLLSGVIYLHPIQEPKFQGTARKNLNMFKLFCGDSSMHCVVLATTMWSEGIGEEATKRVHQLKTTKEFWGDMISNGSAVFQHDNTAESALNIIDYIIEKRERVVLSIQSEMIDQGRRIHETSAGQLEHEEVTEEREKARRRLLNKREELEGKLKKEEVKGVQELLEQQEKYEQRVGQKQDEIDKLNMSVSELHQAKEQQAKEEEEKLEKYIAKQDARMQELNENLRRLEAEHDREGPRLPAYETVMRDDSQKGRIFEMQGQISRMSDQLESWKTEKATLKDQEKRKVAKRAMEFGGVGAAFGGVAAGAAVLCTIM